MERIHCILTKRVFAEQIAFQFPALVLSRFNRIQIHYVTLGVVSIQCRLQFLIIGYSHYRRKMDRPWRSLTLEIQQIALIVTFSSEYTYLF